MKKFLVYFSALVLVTSLITSCSDKKKPVKDPFANEYSELFTREDTAALFSQINQFLDYLKQKDLKNATQMIYFLDYDSVKPLNAGQFRRQALTLRFIAGAHDYKLARIMLKGDIDNEAKVDITLFEREGSDDKRPNQTSFYFRPVRYEGKWYLTVKDNITDTRSDLRQHGGDVQNSFADDEDPSEQDEAAN